MMESKLSPHTEPGRSLNIGDEVFDCEYENFGIKFERHIKRISVDLYEYVYESTTNTDFEYKLGTEDFECLAIYGGVEFDFLEASMKITTSEAKQSEFSSEPLTFESASLDSASPKPLSTKHLSPEKLSSESLSLKPLSPEKLSSEFLSLKPLSSEKLSLKTPPSKQL